MRTKNGNRRRDNRTKSTPIVLISAFFCFLFLSMIVYIWKSSAANKQEYINNNYNTRQKILVAQNTRGTIYSRDGEILANTETDEKGKEVRNYPYANEFAHIVGFATNGKAGVEEFANYYLINTGIDLAQKVSYDSKGQKYPGDNVTTTLSVPLQEVCYYALGDRKGAIVVSDPKTGEILAMVSKPDFDPNTIQADWNTFLADKSENANLLNRATQGQYPPGSTFKIVTTLAYLNEHPNDYEDYRFKCTGKLSKDSSTISCYHGEKHGNIDLYGSFAKSCNSSFANIGLGIQKKTFNKVLDDLMFNEELPLDLRYSKSSAKYKDNMPTSEIMQLSIGQGTTGVTPMHMNMITCAVANKGTLMKPYFIKDIKTADGKVVKSYEPESYKRLMSEKESELLTEMMKQVVEKGTASKLKGLSYTAAGKTGSAEFNSDKSHSHAWFTGFAPAEDPKICLTVIVEDAGSGGSAAVPVAKRIFDIAEDKGMF